MKFRFITLLCVFALCSNVYAERNSEEQNRLLKVNNEAIKDSKHINLDQKHVEESDVNVYIIYIIHIIYIFIVYNILYYHNRIK